MTSPITSHTLSRRQFRVGDLQFDALIGGTGPLVMLLHGFPEGGRSWHAQVQALAEAGYMAVAPDLRGYGGSSKPPLVEDYALMRSVGDVVGVADALGAERFTVAGHDWGGGLAWHVALAMPERVAAVFVLSYSPRDDRVKCGKMRPFDSARARSTEGQVGDDVPERGGFDAMMTAVVNDRYEIRQSLGKGGMGEVFLAYDRTTQQLVALRVLHEESRMPGDDQAMREELLLARSFRHPNVCRLYDLAPSQYGPILVMEYITGQTLHADIRREKVQGGYTADEFRLIAHDVASAVAAIHAHGLAHGNLTPRNVMVTTKADGSFGQATVLDVGFAKERARASSRRPGAAPDGGRPNDMSPERIRSGGARPDDDLYALALTLLEMWTCRVPEPGYKPRAKTLRQQSMFDVPSGLSIDEIKQVYRSLSDDRQQRIPARQLRFFNPVILTMPPTGFVGERLDPGPPPGRDASQAFVPGTQALLATFATNAPEFVGELVSLDKPVVGIGRRADNDLCVPEATVSGQHAQLKWHNATWIVEDLGSINGTYVDHTYERRKSVNLMHGGEVQLGELRFKLVSFGVDSANHKRARAYLANRDGLTGMLTRDQMLRALDEERGFVDWVEAPLTLARYVLRGPNRLVSDRPTILEMLALRRAAKRVVELTETLLRSLIPVTAGRTGPLSFHVAMVGPGQEEARNLVEQVLGQVQGLLPDGLELVR